MLTQNPDKGFLKYMMRLALPIALQNLLMASFQLIDSAMVSRLGNAAMAGVSMAGRWSFIMMITLFGINSGASILYSQYKGVNDETGIRRVYGFALLNSMALVLLCGLVMAIFPGELVRVFAGYGGQADEIVREGAAFMRIIAFNCVVMGFNYATTFMLRSTEEVRVPLVTSLVAVTINTGLNLVLIYGNLGMPAMGVRGAAVSTLVSSAVQAILLIAILRRRRHYAFTHMRDLMSFTRQLAAKFYAIASPVFANELLWSLGTSVYMFVFGRVGGVNGVPAYSLYSGVDQLLFSFVIGMGSACGVMVGQAVGAGDMDRAWREAKRFLVLGTLFAAAMGIAEILLRVPLIDLIRPEDAATGELAKQLLLVGSFGLPFRMLSMLLIVAIFRSGGKPTLGAVIDVGCIWFVGVPVVAAAGFVFHLPFMWLFACMFAEELFKVGLGLIFFFRKKWMRKLTEDTAVETTLPAEAG
jgi:putative MATE family efflux protein